MGKLCGKSHRARVRPRVSLVMARYRACGAWMRATPNAWEASCVIWRTKSTGADKTTKAAGRQLVRQRMGQINLSCANCHDERWGQKLAGVTIVQGHPTGYPIYRLEWQGVGSLERRIRNCMNAVRAEPFAPGALPVRQLELYLKWRARGMLLETPAVRP